jgi:signal transduction histidine kinase
MMNVKSGVRQISAELGSVALDTLGLTAAIEWRARQFQKLTGVPCKLTEDPAAPASRVAVALTITPQDVTVRFSLPLA